MIDLAKIKLPGCIECGGQQYAVRTDFRDWICFSRILARNNAVVDEADFIYSEKIPPAEMKPEAFAGLVRFYSPRNVLPRSTDGGRGGKILDYDIDADLIYSAFMECYGIDLLETDAHGHARHIHWHKFLALLSGLHGTKLNEIMSWRCYNPDDKTDWNGQMEKLRETWRLPDGDDARADADLEKFNALFE